MKNLLDVVTIKVAEFYDLDLMRKHHEIKDIINNMSNYELLSMIEDILNSEE